MDLLQLIRKRLCDLNATATDVGVRVFGTSRGLLQVLAHSQNLSFKAFCVLCDELGVSKEPDELRVWIGALLQYKSPPAMVRLLRIAGLLEDEEQLIGPPESSERSLNLAAVLGSGWREFSRVPAAGRLRQQILGALTVAEEPVSIGTIAGQLCIRYVEVSSPIRWLLQQGYVTGLRAKEKMCSPTFGSHQGIAVRWRVTDKGRMAFARARDRDVSLKAHDGLDASIDCLGV
jgi:hypothetical protein